MTSLRLRKIVPTGLKHFGRRCAHLLIFSDVGSLSRFWEVEAHCDRNSPEQKLVAVRIRQLGHQTVYIRRNSTDSRVLFSTFHHQFHLPPREAVGPDAKLILDLGANIGLTMAHLAYRFPQATIVGVELDSGNAALCRTNIASWGERCRVLQGAVWPDEGDVRYLPMSGKEDGLSVAMVAEATLSQSVAVPAIPVNRLLKDYSADSRIDYVKMDIEGAEKEVLRRHTEWARRVKCIKVELHGGYSKADCLADLQRLGFKAVEDRDHSACVIGVQHV